jgi:hypothetical protein
MGSLVCSLCTGVAPLCALIEYTLLIKKIILWSNNRENECWSRIDRFLLSRDWEEQFLDVFKRRLPRLFSYHFHLLLDCGVVSRRSQYFKFENMWLKLEGFVEQVKVWWKSYNFQGSPSYVRACQLRALKTD